MNKSHFHLLAIFFVACFAGCATPFQAPSEAAHIKLERTDSDLLWVYKIWLERGKNQEGLYLTGYVQKRLLGTSSTKGSHLDVLIKNKQGIIIQTEVTGFTPAELRRRPRPPHQVGVYRIRLDPLPDEAACIEVRAHDHPHT